MKISPMFEVEFGQGRVRFVDNGWTLPSIVLDDMLAAFGVIPELRLPFMRASMPESESVAIGDEIVTLIPYAAAFGLFQAAIERGHVPDMNLDAFVRATLAGYAKAASAAR